MSVKHVKKYYKEICEQYLELCEDLNDAEELFRSHVWSEERYNEIKTMIQPLMQNYERISYIMYLLYLPNKTPKKKKYEERMSKALKDLNKSNSLEAVKEENKNILSKVGNLNA